MLFRSIAATKKPPRGVAFFQTSFMYSKLSTPILVFVAALLCGCAGYSPHQGHFGQPLDVAGESQDVLVARLGPPERALHIDGLRVLHFPRGPAGSHTYFVYVDNQDRVVKWEQVLTEERFNTIQPGMNQDEVVNLIGITKITNGLARNRGYVWHYRYETPHCKSFVIEFTPEDTVRSSGYRFRNGRKCKYVGSG